MKALSENATAQVEAILNSRFGLDEETLGSGSLEQALRQRLEDIETESMHAYADRLASDEAELQALVEQLLVPETWFFRDVLPFECLRRFVLEDWRPRTSERKLRVLSVPCSTGEEPYSIAMTLLDQGYDASSLRIDGVDLSSSSLAKASKGVYGKMAFRGDDHQFSAILQQNMEQHGDSFSVKPDVRKTVSFQRANLADADFLRHEAVYDVIFCRNVLIYFHARAREIALANLHRLLAPGGLLYVGHVEASIIADGPFRSLDSFPFAFRPLHGDDTQRIDSIKKETRVVAPRPRRAKPRSNIIYGRVPVPSPVKPEKPKVSQPPNESDGDLLRSARKAADSGRLEEAEGICTNVLARSPASVDAFFLLGLINQAQNNIPAAERHFQKALYLAPQHHESLVHMMLIAQQRGDQSSAVNYRRRAQQAESTGGAP